jgi:hypothetical protein
MMSRSSKFFVACGALALLAGLAASPAEAKDFHQCFTRKSSRQTYCSASVKKSHDQGNVWVTAALTHFGIQRSDTTNYVADTDTPCSKSKNICWN